MARKWYPKERHRTLSAERFVSFSCPSPWNVSFPQKDFMKALQDEGTKVAVCYSAEEAREMIRFYLSPAEGFNLVNCEDAIRTVDGCEGYGVDFAPCDKSKNHIKR